MTIESVARRIFPVIASAAKQSIPPREGTQRPRSIAPEPPAFIPSGLSIVVMVVVMVVMPMGHPDDDARPISVMMMMMVVMVILRELDISVPRRRRPLFVERLQQRARIRDRLQQVGIGIGLQRVGRGWRWRGMRSPHRSERCHRSQKSGYPLFQSILLCPLPREETSICRNGSRKKSPPSPEIRYGEFRPLPASGAR
jgi:hypothetical protein